MHLPSPSPHKNKNARPPRSTTFFLLKILSDFVSVDVLAIHFRDILFKLVSDPWLVPSHLYLDAGIALALFEGRGRLYKRWTAREKRDRRKC